MHGTYKNEWPRLEKARGWNPTTPTLSNTVALPVEAQYVNAPIWSGMVISPSVNGKAWIPGVAAGQELSPNLTVYIAQDCSTDSDVTEAKSLVGLPCTGNYKLGTPQFVKSLATASTATTGTVQSYTTGVPLTFARDGEFDVREGVARSAVGMLRPAAVGEYIIGHCSPDIASNTSPAGVVTPEGLVSTQANWILRTSPATVIARNAFMLYFTTDVVVPAAVTTKP